jgi:hypothetical protein
MHWVSKIKDNLGKEAEREIYLREWGIKPEIFKGFLGR